MGSWNLNIPRKIDNKRIWSRNPGVGNAMGCFPGEQAASPWRCHENLEYSCSRSSISWPSRDLHNSWEILLSFRENPAHSLCVFYWNNSSFPGRKVKQTPGKCWKYFYKSNGKSIGVFPPLQPWKNPTEFIFTWIFFHLSLEQLLSQTWNIPVLGWENMIFSGAAP